MYEVILDNRNGDLWNVTRIIFSIKWKTSRIGKAASVDIKLVKHSPFASADFTFGMGDIVRIHKDGLNLFHGYIFSIDESEETAASIIAYDQMRYLMTSDTYLFSNTTATKIIDKIIDDSGLKAGQLTDTGYVIPKMLEDSKKLMDIICKALDLTLIRTGRLFVFYDDYGLLRLRDMQDMMLNTVIGDKSSLYGYKHKRSIDSDTFNRLKFVQDNQQTGKRDVYILQDSETIAKWGRLQYYEKVDDGMNAAQINEAMDNFMLLKNRETRSLSLEAIGDARIRAGSVIYVRIEELRADGWYVVEACTHNLEGDEHTMSLELKVYGP